MSLQNVEVLQVWEIPKADMYILERPAVVIMLVLWDALCLFLKKAGK